MTRSAPFVGRVVERRALLAALDAGSRLVLVVGDAGIGKTRLCAEALAPAADTVVLVGSCLPMTEVVPLLPMTQALRQLDRVDAGRLLGAALDRLPPYVRPELARLVPRLGDVTEDLPAAASERRRLFTAVGELLADLARDARVVLLVEDLHWADTGTLDLLTYLCAATEHAPVTVVGTCRSDEHPLAVPVQDWLARARQLPDVTELRLAPLAREAVAEQVAGLLDDVPAALVDELYARAEGNPFFTEQLVAASRAGDGTGDGGSGPVLPRRLPTGLAELLVARVRGVPEPGRDVLAALAVAGRPLPEPWLADIVGADPVALELPLRDMRGRALLAPVTETGVVRLRHAVLAEAIRGDLLPGQRTRLHARTAAVLEAVEDPALAAEVAGHWAGAGRPADELRATLAAARAALRVLAATEAADLWLRAIALSDEHPAAAADLRLDRARLHLDAVDALDACGRGEEAVALAEQTYARFADWPDTATAAVVHARTAHFRSIDSTAAARPLLERALELFAGTPPSADHAYALMRYAGLRRSEGHGEAGLADLERALAVAEAAGDAVAAGRVLANIAHLQFVRGEVEEGFATLDRVDATVDGTDDVGGITVARTYSSVFRSDALLKLGRLEEAREVAVAGVEQARRGGRGASFDAAILLSNAVEATVEMGRTDDAARLVDPVTAGRPALEHWVLHACRAQVDLRRGRAEEADRRLRVIRELAVHGDVDFDRELTEDVATVAIWRSAPEAALDEVEQALRRLEGTEQERFLGDLLVLGARAAADLAVRHRACWDRPGEAAALAALERLTAAVDRMGGRPFEQHPYLPRVAADRAGWAAESRRAAGLEDPDAWSAVARSWEAMGYAHRAGYAWWRCAEASLGQGGGVANGVAAAAPPLRAAAAAAIGHAPLLAAVTGLAQRARISLDVRPAERPSADARPSAEAAAAYRLTGREQLVLKLVVRGRTNAEIGAELFMSPKTASVHVTNILRKLGVTNRVQAAALAERAGLVDEGPVVP